MKPSINGCGGLIPHEETRRRFENCDVFAEAFVFRPRLPHRPHHPFTQQNRSFSASHTSFNSKGRGTKPEALHTPRTRQWGTVCGAPGLSEVFERWFRAISAGVAVAFFAFFSDGVAIGGLDGFVTALRIPITIGIGAALVLGKPGDILATTWIVVAVTRALLDQSVKWMDPLGVAILGGIGFTVSLLVAELNFGLGSDNGNRAKVAILLATLIDAVLATVVLWPRNRWYHRV